MRKRVGLSLVGMFGVALLAVAGAAWSETWKPAPGEAKTFYDEDFMRLDEASGLVTLRFAEGRANGPYKSWPAGKGPILLFALDCAADKWIDLGMDFTGDQGLPKGWRQGEKIDDISGATGGAGKLACERRDSLPKIPAP